MLLIFYVNGMAMMNINWNLYKQFYFVAKHGSTSAASKELMVAQPSVSLGIKQLENQLGCELFKRSHRGMELTEQGEILYEYVSTAYKAIVGAEEFALNYRRQEKNTIRVAAIDTTLQIFLMPVLENFKKLAPEINIKIRICNEVPDAEKLMDSGSVDFAVMHFPSGKEGFLNEPVKKISDALVCATDYAERLPDSCLRAEELENYTFVTLNRNSPSRNVLEKYLKDNGLDIGASYEFMHSSSIIRQIKQDFALGFVLENVVKYELERGELVKIEVEPPIPPRYYYMIRPKEEISPLAQKLVNYILTTRGEL